MVSQSVENSAKTGTRKTSKQERVRFIFEPGRSSLNGITFTWLIHDTYEGKEKAAVAARSFWLPIAYQESGKYSEAELRQVAQDCIWQLEAQIQFLRLHFNLTADQHSHSTIHSADDRSKHLPERESHSAFLNTALAIDKAVLNELIEALS
ncbi:hypothetical protein H6F89_29335 [Cyanobacteria bacterium FACHB-63]|nr:hypothetical protein [Cyanobacteria bacterium FACHB-63]